MSNLQEVEKNKLIMETMVELSSVFEGVAGMRIARIKNQVLQATEFFNDLWGIYKHIRVDGSFRFGRGQESKDVIDKELYIVITGEGGFSGDIDQKLIHYMLESYDKDKNEIIVIGHHGAAQLAQKDISFKKYFKLPIKDQNIDVIPIIKIVQQYKTATVFYQEYVSLMVQDVKKIELSKAVVNQGASAERAEEGINEQTYIFEPSAFAVVDHLERTMMQIALSQLILNSKLAQYASRFRAMSTSHQLADESLRGVNIFYERTKRGIKDERLKEIINGIKKASLSGGEI